MHRPDVESAETLLNNGILILGAVLDVEEEVTLSQIRKEKSSLERAAVLSSNLQVEEEFSREAMERELIQDNNDYQAPFELANRSHYRIQQETSCPSWQLRPS